MYKSSSQTMRVAVYGGKHDPSAFEGLLRELADMTSYVSVTQAGFCWYQYRYYCYVAWNE